MGRIDLEGELADKTVNTIRMLALDAVEKAGCGHPGLPMGAADIAFVLWTQFLNFDPSEPEWPNRDRFVLSAGHGSMLLYSLLHLTGYELSMEELKNFRQLHSKTPGHPEYWCAPGVETTTGPLGQGFANGVGMAIASKMMAARFNTDRHTVVDNAIYVLTSDGDLMEGISHEAASLAGHLGLNNLICIYDDNHVTIEGGTSLAYSEHVRTRFEGYHWFAQAVDGHDREAVAQAIERARAEQRRPSIIVARTRIGYGSPNMEGTAEIHGKAVGSDEVKATKQNLGWPLAPEFLVPDDVRQLLRSRGEEGKKKRGEWRERFEAFRKDEPQLAAQWAAMMERRVPPDLMDKLLESAAPDTTATRKASGKVMQVAADLVPSMVGGSADLAPSTNTILDKYGHIARNAFDGRNFHFGVREHAMGGVLSGVALYGGFIPYGATFLVFADYMRPPIRLASLMKARVVYVFTHDSIFVGEDGPTHQAVEQVASLRAIPNLHVIRPCGAPETAAAWAAALERTDGPTALILTRQNVPALDAENIAGAELLRKGGYVISEASGRPQLILVASGSEVPLAVEVQEKMQADGTPTRVVSMPCQEQFDLQPDEYKDQVLPPDVNDRVAIEAAVSFGWHKYVGRDGLTIAIDRFGESAPYQVLQTEFGFTCSQVVERINAWRKR